MHELGKGSSGSVHLATLNGEFVAVKKTQESSNGLGLLLEADAMSSIRNNRNAVKLIAICREPGNSAIIMVRRGCLLPCRFSSLHVPFRRSSAQRDH